jgi:glycosyltransferase involved in cell wall biosynthesis
MVDSLISCIVPVFNGERYLAETLDSIIAQTYRPLEIIVVDDGSTDGTVSIIERYGSPVRYLEQPNSGAPAARNRGLWAAKGEFISFLDADDLWPAEKLRLQMERFEARPELDICVGHLQSFWIPELRREAERFRDHPLAQPQPGYVTTTLLARRALFDEVGGFKDTLRVGDPMDWFLRAGEYGAVMELLPEVLSYRRMHHANISWESSSTGEMTEEMRSSILRVIKDSLDRRRDKSGKPRALQFPDPREVPEK